MLSIAKECKGYGVMSESSASTTGKVYTIFHETHNLLQGERGEHKMVLAAEVDDVMFNRAKNTVPAKRFPQTT